MDILADILRTQRLRGTVYFRADFREPWGLDIQGGEFANFHIVAQGRCWLRTAQAREPRALERGDVVIFPKGDPHALLHAPSAVALPASRVLATSEPDPNNSGQPVYGGDGAVTTTLICGHFEFDRRYPHPLLETLPPLVHVPAAHSGDADWLTAAGQLAAVDSGTNRPGAGAVVDRLAEALLIQALLGYVAEMTKLEANTFLAALQDRCIGRSLSVIHEETAKDWNVTNLASTAGLSRSVFTERFRTLVGESPMVYLARWRMLKARELLLDTSLTISQVADAVGYQSEFSFSKAFKRLFGFPPGTVRTHA